MCVDAMDKEFEQLIDEFTDCPEELFKLAKTPFEKAVAVEFFALHKKLDEQTISSKKDINWLKWLIVSVFGLTVLGVLSQWYPIIIKIFTGA
jgi:hypothetical protein